MDPTHLLVKRLLSSKETSDKQSFVLSDFLKWLLLVIIGATILVGSEIVVDGKISCTGDKGNVAYKSAENYCISESYTIQGINSLDPGVGIGPAEEKQRVYQTNYAYHFYLLCICVMILFAPRILVWCLKGNSPETFNQDYLAEKESLTSDTEDISDNLAYIICDYLVEHSTEHFKKLKMITASELLLLFIAVGEVFFLNQIFNGAFHNNMQLIFVDPTGAALPHIGNKDMLICAIPQFNLRVCSDPACWTKSNQCKIC